MLKTQEHQDLMEMFEREMKQHPTQRCRFDKEAKGLWAMGRIYQDGTTNAIFDAYRRGYAYGKAICSR